MKNFTHKHTIIVLIVFTFLVALPASAQEQQVTTQENLLFDSAQSDWNGERWESAVAKYKLFVQQYPSHPLAVDAHFQLGYYFSYVGSPEEAMTEYLQTIALAPGTHDAHEAKVGIAALKFWEQDYAGAYELFRQVIVETDDWSMIKECVFRMKELGRLIQLQKLPEQRNAMVDCGPRSLEVVFNNKHIKTTDKEMEKLVALGRRGATMDQLKEAAQSKGLAAWGVRVDAKQLDKLPRPFIVHIRPSHFVVVTKANKGKVEFTDPHRGNTYRTKEMFQRLWRGYALVFAKNIPSKLRTQLLSKDEMRAIHGGHHLHGVNLGGAEGNPASKFENDPNACSGPGLPHWSVNLSNYNFLVQDTDFSYSGRGPSVGLTRMYNADDPREGAFGRSWTFNYDVFLVVSPNGSVDIKREGGKVDNFMARGDGTFDPPRWVHDQLIKNADGTYKLLLKNSKLTQSFNAQGKLSQITDRNNNSVTLKYDAGGRLISVTDAVARVTQFAYNAAGKISQVTDPIGRKATFSYDANNNLVTTVDMAGNVSTFTYNGTSYLTSLTTPNGTTQVRMGTTPHFTEFPGLLKEIVDPLGKTTRYDTGDYIAWVIDARGNQTFYFNDGLGQTTEIEDPLGNKAQAYFLTPAGDLTNTIDANGNITSLTYDSRGNVITILDPLGNRVSFTYDSQDNVTQIVDPANRGSSFQYDDKGNLTKVTDTKNGVTAYVYDNAGQMTALTDRRGNTTSFTYDSAGNLTKVTSPGGNVITNSFDGVGRIVSQTDHNLQTFSYIYDGIDRLTRITQPGGTTTNYNYGCCRLATIEDSNGILSFVYDAANRVTKFTNTRNQVIQYSYDAHGNLIGLVYPDGKVVHYEYDAANRLKKVTDWLSNVTSYNYDAASNLISSVNTNGTLAGYQHDSTQRQLATTNARSNGSVISASQYHLDGLNNRTSISAFEPLSPIQSTRNVNHTYDNDNRIVSSSASSYTHDPNGNLTTITGTGSATYAYDVFNRLIQATTAGQTAQYQYDGLGNRMTRTLNGNVTKYIVTPGASISQVLAETDNAGNITSYFVYGHGLISKIASSGQTYFYHYGSTGNTVAITDASGAIVNQYAYDPFGNVSTNSTEGVSNPFRFAGALGVIDDGNGLLYMRARYYAKTTGRFLSVDPIGGSGQNLYVYAANNPLTYVDPTGLVACEWYVGRLDKDPNPAEFKVGLSFGVSIGYAAELLLGVGYLYGFEKTFGLSVHSGGANISAGLSVSGGVGATSGLALGVSSGAFHGYFAGWKCHRCE